jgi:hypothetical protein
MVAITPRLTENARRPCQPILPPAVFGRVSFIRIIGVGLIPTWRATGDSGSLTGMQASVVSINPKE